MAVGPFLQASAFGISDLLVRWLKVNFFMDVDVADKSAIFSPHNAYDLYFTFWVGTASADFNMATKWHFKMADMAKLPFLKCCCNLKPNASTKQDVS